MCGADIPDDFVKDGVEEGGKGPEEGRDPRGRSRRASKEKEEGEKAK